MIDKLQQQLDLLSNMAEQFTELHSSFDADMESIIQQSNETDKEKLLSFKSMQSEMMKHAMKGDLKKVEELANEITKKFTNGSNTEKKSI